MKFIFLLLSSIVSAEQILCETDLDCDASEYICMTAEITYTNTSHPDYRADIDALAQEEFPYSTCVPQDECLRWISETCAPPAQCGGWSEGVEYMVTYESPYIFQYDCESDGTVVPEIINCTSESECSSYGMICA